MTANSDIPPSTQSGTITGDNNIFIQASGAGITIDIDRPHLTLYARQLLAQEPKEYLDLLNPINRAVPVVGRDREQRDLEDWLAGTGISARCLIGGGGSGKTRLALELCTTAEKRGWFAGFVDHGELVRFRSQQNLAAWGWAQPTLIVVDYAAAKVRILRDWLIELIQRHGKSAKPLRILLLERHADPDLGWWPEVSKPRGWEERGLRSVFNPPEPIPLNNITDIEHRRQILKSVMIAASAIKGRNKPISPPAPGEDLAFDHHLADPSLEFAPLHLLIAAIIGVEQGSPSLLTLGPTAMAEELAEYELGRLDKFARDRNLSSDFLNYLAAGITLIGDYRVTNSPQ